MLQKTAVIIFSFSFMLAGFYNNETGWVYEQSTLQSFYIFEDISVDEQTVVGDGATAQDSDQSYCFQNPYSCDVIGAFIDDVCIGWVYGDSNGYTTVPAMGNDGNQPDYAQSGDTINFRVYDSSYGTELSLDLSQTVVDADNDGNPDLFGQAPVWENLEINLIYGSALAINSIPGCMDEQACNYNSYAITDDGSCEFPAINFDCDGNCLIDIDCLGECGGVAVIDECGVCDGSGIADDDCDCLGNILDQCFRCWIQH